MVQNWFVCGNNATAPPRHRATAPLRHRATCATALEVLPRPEPGPPRHVLDLNPEKKIRFRWGIMLSFSHYVMRASQGQESPVRKEDSRPLSCRHNKGATLMHSFFT